jgi:hypothetical protein
VGGHSRPAELVVGVQYGPDVALSKNIEASPVSPGVRVERLVAHRRLPLVAGLDAERPAVHVWDCASGRPTEVAVIGADAPAYGPDEWNRSLQTPSVAWHPSEPALVATIEGGLRRWTPDGVTSPAGVPADAAYQYVALSPNGRTAWAHPSAGADGWEACDAIDLASGTLATTLGWDTGVAEHPGSGLLTTLRSNQGATVVLFATADQGRLRALRHALILDVDGYETPVFSPDGRLMAIRGNAYVNTLEVFAFPSLQRVFGTTLGEPSPGYPYPEEWLEQLRSWSRHNIAFAPGALLVGTPRGTIVELDVAGEAATEHAILGDGAGVSALATLATGEVVVASSTGGLALATGFGDPESMDAPESTDAAELVAAFLAATSPLPDDADLDNDLVLTDGARTWEPEDLDTVTEADASDPSWLQIKAHMNALINQRS